MCEPTTIAMMAMAAVSTIASHEAEKDAAEDANTRTEAVHRNARQDATFKHQQQQTNFIRETEAANEEGLEAALEARSAVAADAASAASAGVSGSSVAGLLASQVAKGERNIQKVGTAREDALLDYLSGTKGASMQADAIINANQFVTGPSNGDLAANLAISVGTAAVGGFASGALGALGGTAAATSGTAATQATKGIPNPVT